MENKMKLENDVECAECTTAKQGHKTLVLENLRACQYGDMATFFRILNTDRGCETPLEGFIQKLVRSYEWKQVSLPEIIEAFEEYESLAESMENGILHYVRQNPQLLDRLTEDSIAPEGV
jgi:hypothetical protein